MAAAVSVDGSLMSPAPRRAAPLAASVRGSIPQDPDHLLPGGRGRGAALPHRTARSTISTLPWMRELTISNSPSVPSTKERRHFALGDATREDDISTVARRRRPRPVARAGCRPAARSGDCAHLKRRDARRGSARRGGCLRRARIGPGDGGHPGLFAGVEFDQVGAPVGRDHEVGADIGPGGFHEDGGRGCRRPAPLSVSPMIQRAVSPAAIGPEPARRSPGSSAMVVIWPGAA